MNFGAVVTSASKWASQLKVCSSRWSGRFDGAHGPSLERKALSLSKGLTSSRLAGSRSIQRVGVNSLHLKLVSIATSIAFGGSLLHAQLAPNDQSARTMQLDRFVVPEFPPFLRQAGVLQGTVAAAIGRDARGRAEDVLVLESSDPRFTDAALDAIREWRFKPLSPAPDTEDAAPVVRFLFTTGSVSVVPLTSTARGGSRRTVRADTPIELPNFSHLDQTPAILHHPPPEFPAALRGRVTQGTVVVKYFIDTTERVRLPTIISASDPALGAAALAAMRQWRYEPPRIDGKPVIALERHSFQFSATEGR